MKGLALVVLCFLAVQARYTGLVDRNLGIVASLGENPWLVHLRVAVSTSGFLNSCVGSLIADSWVVTAASCVQDSRFVWLRYGLVDVFRPELVTETSSVTLHPNWNAQTGANNIALININRVVQNSDNIGQISLSNITQADSGRFCGWGSHSAGSDLPGETLVCNYVSVEQNGDVLQTNLQATRFDLGAPLVSDGEQIGLLVNPNGDFLRPAQYQSWIYQVTGS